MRAPEYRKLTSELSEKFGLKVLDRYWIVKGILAEVPLSAVKVLAERKDITSIELEQTDIPPPQLEDVAGGRALINSDPYFSQSLSQTHIALLDTGVRFSHTVFNNPSRISARYDCTNGVCDNLPDPSDDCWNHGTRSASVISANNNLGNDYRGVTPFPIKSYKVYTCSGLNRNATQKAFEHAMQTGNTVIVAEMQDSSGETGSTSQAAENAFVAGAAVIAANGNYGGQGAGSVRAPANAHRVIGVGAYNADSLKSVFGPGLRSNLRR